VISVWASAAMLRNVNAIKIYFDFIGVELGVGIRGSQCAGSWDCLRDAQSIQPYQLFHSCSRKREANGGKKFLVVEGLAEKCRRPRVQSCRSNQWIILSSKDYDAGRRRNFAKPRLHIQTVHQRHPDIYHRDGSAMSLDVKEELLGIAELFGVPTSRPEQPAQAFQHRRIIVEQANNVGIRIRQS